MLRTLLILLCVISTVNAAAQKTAPKTSEKKITEIDYKQMGAPMPRMRLQIYKDTASKNGIPQTAKEKTEYTYFTNKDIDNGSLLVMMFNPTCSHCEDETALIENSIDEFKNTNLVLMANPGMKQYLPDFVNRLHITEYPSIHVGIDSADFINKVYLYGMLPQINIYDRERKLVKTFNGEIPIDSLIKYTK